MLRCCGLLDQSVAAHEKATALDPAITTSVAHTHFLRCEYEATLETYGATGYYLDAAAWAALGNQSHAIQLLTDRLDSPGLSTLMSGLMGSLLEILQGRPTKSIDIMTSTDVVREPEVLFYLARHFSLADAPSESLQMIQRARREGFTSSQALEHDAAFAVVREHPHYKEELKSAQEMERESKSSLLQAGKAIQILCS